MKRSVVCCDGTWKRPDHIARHRGKAGEQVVAATNVEPLIAPERFDAIQAARPLRDLAAGANRRPGRPSTRFALAAGLAYCGHRREDGFVCGGRMRGRVSPYKRKDGTQRRTYLCEHAFDGSGLCDAPAIDAEAVDSALIGHLDGFFLDFEGWLADVLSSRGAQRHAQEDQLERERDRLATLNRREPKLRERWTGAIEAGDDLKERIAYETLEALLKERDDLKRKIAAREQEVEALSEENAPVDAMLDFWNELSAEVRGKLAEGRSKGLAEVNAQLHEVLARVELTPGEAGIVRIEATMAESGLGLEPDYTPPPDEDPDAPIVLPADVTWSRPLDQRLIITRAGGLPVKGLEVKSANAHLHSEFRGPSRCPSSRWRSRRGLPLLIRSGSGCSARLAHLLPLPALSKEVEDQLRGVDRLVDRPDRRERAAGPGVTRSALAVEADQASA
jgi:Recombinase zinc beta ribbon domain